MVDMYADTGYGFKVAVIANIQMVFNERMEGDQPPLAGMTIFYRQYSTGKYTTRLNERLKVELVEDGFKEVDKAVEQKLLDEVAVEDKGKMGEILGRRDLDGTG